MEKIKHTPTCFVCKKTIQELVEIKEMKEAKLSHTDYFLKTIKRLGEKGICVGFDKEGEKILRHTGFCSPGAKTYMKNPELRKGYNENVHPRECKKKNSSYQKKKNMKTNVDNRQQD